MTAPATTSSSPAQRGSANVGVSVRIICQLVNIFPCPAYDIDSFRYIWACRHDYLNFGRTDGVVRTAQIEAYSPASWAQWVEKRIDLGADKSGNRCERIDITTPKGVLHQEIAITDVTTYDTEYLLKSLRNFEIWNEFFPVPMPPGSVVTNEGAAGLPGKAKLAKGRTHDEARNEAL